MPFSYDFRIVCTEYYISGFVEDSAGGNGIYTLLDELNVPGDLPMIVSILFHEFSATEVVYVMVLQGPHDSGTVNIWAFQMFSALNAARIFMQFIKSLLSELSDFTQSSPSQNLLQIHTIVASGNLATFLSDKSCGIDCVLENIGKSPKITQYDTSNFPNPSVTCRKVPY